MKVSATDHEPETVDGRFVEAVALLEEVLEVALECHVAMSREYPRSLAAEGFQIDRSFMVFHVPTKIGRG